MRAVLSLAFACLLALPALASADCDADTKSHHHHFDWDMSVFGWDRDPDETRIQVLDLALFSLVDVRRREPHDSRVEILDAPLVTGFERRTSEHGHLIRVLDVPLFSLFEWKRQRDDVDLGVINLPLIGSLYRHRVDDDGRRTNVLFLFRFKGPAPQVPRSPATKRGRLPLPLPALDPSGRRSCRGRSAASAAPTSAPRSPRSA